MWRRMVNVSNMFGYLAHLHIFIEAAKDLEPTHCHALCSSKWETGGLDTQSEGEHYSPDSFSHRFVLLTRKELWCHGLHVEHWVQSISFESEHAGVYAGVISRFLFSSTDSVWDTMWIFHASTASSRSALGFWCSELRHKTQDELKMKLWCQANIVSSFVLLHGARPTPKHGTRPAWRKVNEQRC